MYYPLQIPYILSKEFSSVVQYSEETVDALKDFTVCFWEMRPKTDEAKTVENVILTDGCVDLVADFAHKQIGFVGMSKTNFSFQINTPCRFYGVRMKPGAFYALTGITVAEVMDGFIPLQSYDSGFDAEAFFDLPVEKAKAAIQDYMAGLCAGKRPNEFVGLFDRLFDDIPATAAELYARLHFSSKQTERLFLKNFGLPPRVVLSILRFQKCLRVLAGGSAAPADILNLVNFYDQAHFINDFKRNLGLTPFELVLRYK